MWFIKLLWALSALIVCAQATGTFVVLHSPDKLNFLEEDKVHQSSLKDVYGAALGYTVNRSISLMSYESPFDLPKAVVVVVVEGVDSLEMIEGKKYPLIPDQSEETTWQLLSNLLQKRILHNFTVRLYLGDGLDALGHSTLGDLKPNSTDNLDVKALNLKNQVNQKFLEELQLLNAIAEKVKTVIKSDNKSGLYWLVVSELKNVLDVNKDNSEASNEAISLLNKTLQNVSNAFKQVYDDKVLITAFTNNFKSSNLRKKREVNDEVKNTEETTANKVEKNSGASSKVSEDELPEKNYEDPNIIPADEYSDDFPVVFNMIFWFMVVFIFTLLAICVFIGDMDPGRDSIIYRMTSNRMKKDN